MSLLIPSRLRRLRRTPWLREMVAETRLQPSNFIQPIFICEGSAIVQPIEAMPGINVYSIDKACEFAKSIEAKSIPAVILFPAVEHNKKTPMGDEAFKENNLISRAITAIKKSTSNLGVFADVALDPYTSHGHDGILNNDDVDNDKTVELLAKQALVLAEAGCDAVAPSDMMDGRVKYIREALDKHEFINVMIISYAAKYASSLYGPFRDGIGSKKCLTTNKKTYQMDPANSLEALHEVQQDIEESADIVIVKPAGYYLDIIKQVSEVSLVPVIGYQVSGEYTMIKMAANAGYLDYKSVIWESLIAIKRAGARSIITYAAHDLF